MQELFDLDGELLHDLVVLDNLALDQLAELGARTAAGLDAQA